MPTINANTSTSVTLAAGTRMEGSGACVITWGTPTRTQAPGVAGTWNVGPFAASVTLSISALTAVTYTTYTGGEIRDDLNALAFTAAQRATLAAMTGYGGRRVLKATTGAYTITGGTAGTKTTLLQVALPDDDWSIANLGVRLVIEYGVYYTNSANTKTYGIDIGATAGAAVALRTQTPTTTASETTLMVVQRDAANPTRLRIILPNNYRSFGNAPASGSTVGILASASIDPTATGQSLFFHGAVNPNSEAITFEHVYVALEKAEA